ncbi:hypothetical protein PR202_ga31273 [Eleusine coracana subsp. coracana]|uniref:Uncharacterized protein n=1 Tax=Eleusine coracana subsp. coracana TaxID=191504 RepID=A0AAV5DPK2_ELECO|nr:hypothetical protein PR202_ga31273 [Eleusine coracana subsp. coracana]
MDAHQASLLLWSWRVKRSVYGAWLERKRSQPSLLMVGSFSGRPALVEGRVS